MRNDDITNLRGYGDVNQVNKDSKALMDILSRQGVGFATDVIAEHVGRAVLKYKMSPEEVSRLRLTLLNELEEAINERT